MYINNYLFNKAVLVLFFTMVSFVVSAKEYNVLDYGATADGVKLNTEIIQRAIDDATEGGGIVVFPAGKYLTGTLYLKSNVSIRLEKGAVLLGSTDLIHYPENLPDYSFFRKDVIKRALIYAENVENISIKGEGTIDGQGSAFEEPKDKNISSYSVRPYVIWMIKCKNIKIEGIRLQNSALWMQHYLACEKLYIHNIEVYNHSNKNNDMMDIDGCKDVIISDCRGDTDDDGITLKSTHAQPNENITITNCILSSHCNAIKCGTESNAGFKNITISNCVIRPSRDREVIYGKPDGISGISLEVVDGAELNGVNISNIVMDGPIVPIFIRLGNRARGYDKALPKPGVGSIENVHISNVTAYNAGDYGSSISGIPGYPVKNISMENVRIFYSGGGTPADADKSVDEKEKSYPEATMFGKLPAYGMFIRHAENVRFSNVEFYLAADDRRSPFFLEDVKHGQFRDLKADINQNTSYMKANNVSDIFLANPVSYTKSKAAIEIQGSQSSTIRLSDVNKKQFGEIWIASDEVSRDEILTSNIFE